MEERPVLGRDFKLDRKANKSESKAEGNLVKVIKGNGKRRVVQRLETFQPYKWKGKQERKSEAGMH